MHRQVQVKIMGSGYIVRTSVNICAKLFHSLTWFSHMHICSSITVSLTCEFNSFFCTALLCSPKQQFHFISPLRSLTTSSLLMRHDVLIYRAQLLNCSPKSAFLTHKKIAATNSTFSSFSSSSLVVSSSTETDVPYNKHVFIIFVCTDKIGVAQ